MGNHIITNLGALIRPFIRGKLFVKGVPVIVQDRPTILEANRRGYDDIISGQPNPPPPSFDAGGVNFDGATTLINAALASGANTDKLGLSFWFNLGDTPGYPIAFDPATSGSGVLFGSPAIGGYFSDVTGADFVFAQDADGFSGAVWHHYLQGLNSTSGESDIFIDGVSVKTALSSAGTPFTWASNGLNCFVGTYDGETQNLVGDLAEVWCSNSADLLTGGTISPATVAKFYNAGAPVDLGLDGSIPTGTAPAIYLHRSTSGAASTFATNRGTGGSFATTGTLTASSTNP